MKKLSILFSSALFLLLFLAGFPALPQQIKKDATYEKDILLIKLKLEFKDAFNTAFYLKEINDLIQPAQIILVKQTYPGINKPTESNHIDLTRIYTLTFKGIDYNALPTLIPKLKQTNYFEYVELKYMHEQQTFFYPNDQYVGEYQQKYLDRMGAFKAWDIEKGDSTVVIGIVDTGIDATHPDLMHSIAYNTADPINGVDDDNDGYIDNYAGWDFGNNDNNPTVIGTSSKHGANVSGIAGATANNGIGGVGTGFYSKILPLKASPDNGGGAITNGNDAIIYAAQHGCKVINLSYGNTSGFSSVDQDVINFAAINNDVLIVAAAGNTDEEASYYPASYENVLSVIALDTIFSPSANKYIDTRANFKNWDCCYKATYGRSVDIGAQGMGLFTVDVPNKYTLQDGSSAASPLVAGAAALLRSHYPNISALQAAELLRVTADIMDTFPENALYKGKMGKGRINIYNALTDTKSPSIRYKNLSIVSKNGAFIFTGDTVMIQADFFNFLRPTKNITVSISSDSPQIDLLVSTINMGIIDSLSFKTNTSNPLTCIVKNTASKNQTIEIRIDYSDPLNGYQDYQYFNLLVNPAYTTLYNDHIKTTITSKGIVGYDDIYNGIGVGLESNGTNVLYEGGLMIGQNSTTVSDCVRGYPKGTSDLDFKSLKNVSFVDPTKKYKETISKFNDSSTTNQTIQGIECIQRSYTFNEAELETTVFLEYKIINKSNADIDSIYIGQFMDWDVQNYDRNRCWFDSDSRLGYAYDISQNNLYVGLSLLSNQELHYYAMDNSAVGGNNINPNEGYSKSDKFNCLSSKIGRDKAGYGPAGNDISMTLSGRINNLKRGDTAIIAFALLTSHTTLLDLKVSAAAAIKKYIDLHTGPIPLNDSISLCTKDTSDILIEPKLGKKFNFYTSIPTATSVPIHQGRSYLLTQVSAPDTLYITNSDSLYESKYSKFVVITGKAPLAAFRFSTNNETNTSTFTNESLRYKNAHWNFGDNETSTLANPSHTYILPGDYEVTLQVTDQGHCLDSIKKPITIVTPSLSISAIYDSKSISIFPVPVTDVLIVEFHDAIQELVDIAIYNALGQEVLQRSDLRIQNNQVQLPVSSLNTGLYFIQVKNTSIQLRFTKQ